MSIDSYIKKHNFEKFDDTFKVEQAKTIKNPRKNTKIIGNIGKSKVGKKLQLQGLNVLIAKSNKNLLLLPGPVDKTPFKKSTVICVHTRGKNWYDVIPPTKEEINYTQGRLQQCGLDFWIAFVKYTFEKENAYFEIYLLNTKKLNPTDDFKRVTRKNGYQYQIITKNMEEKADLKFIEQEEQRMSAIYINQKGVK